MRTLDDVHRSEVARIKWCERPVLLKVLLKAFDQVEQAHRGPKPLLELERAHRIRSWLERVSPRV